MHSLSKVDARAISAPSTPQSAIRIREVVLLALHEDPETQLLNDPAAGRTY